MQPGANLRNIFTLFQESHDRLQERLDAIGGESEGRGCVSIDFSTPSHVGTTLHCYGGRLNLLPHNFAFPKMSVWALITHWLLPDK